jgi:AcrR family transcriptional regulator
MTLKGAHKVAKPISVRGKARDNVLNSALKLFAEFGINGTSLHMIARDMGVTKAAVYYQFRAKEDIVIALIQPALEQIKRFVVQGESAANSDLRREIAVRGIVDTVVDHRQGAALLQSDQGVAEIFRSQPQMPALLDQITALIVEANDDVESRVSYVIMVNGLMMAGSDPKLKDLSDKELRDSLYSASMRLLKVKENS